MGAQLKPVSPTGQLVGVPPRLSLLQPGGEHRQPGGEGGRRARIRICRPLREAASQVACLAGSRARIETEVPDGPLSLPTLADLPGSPGLKLVNHKCLIAFYCFRSKKICCQKILTSFYFTQEPCSCWMWSLGSTLTPRSVQSCQYCAATPVGSPTRGPLAVYWLDTTAMALGYYHVGLCAMPIIVMAEFPGCTSPSGL